MHLVSCAIAGVEINGLTYRPRLTDASRRFSQKLWLDGARKMQKLYSERKYMSYENNKLDSVEESILKIRKSFCIEKLSFELIFEIEDLVKDDLNFNVKNVRRKDWRVIASKDTSGQIFNELDILIKWWKDNEVEPLYATSLQRIKNRGERPIILMKFDCVDYSIINQIQVGGWMFGENISDLGKQRISDWRNDVYFSDPLKFLVLSVYDGDGGTTIAGPSEIIDLILEDSKKYKKEENTDWQEIRGD